MQQRKDTPLEDGRLSELAGEIKQWSQQLGFADIGISDINLRQAEHHLDKWLEQDYHGDMDYMSRHGTKRTRPAELLPGTQRVIMLRMDYRVPAAGAGEILEDSSKAYIARYTLGRDYHKVVRRRLARLADQMTDWCRAQGLEHHVRVFTDSAPVMEKPLAEKAGLGWIGKNTLLIHPKAGSWYFLGAIYTNLPLPLNDQQIRDHCGSCHACMDVCPTDAIVAPYVLDARRCISYLTIESKGSIPTEFREAVGNRVFGCDDCQLVCPWNRYSRLSHEPDFSPRHQLDQRQIIELFEWDEAMFLKKTEGSAIRRTGYAGWRRNLAVALGNSPYRKETVAALEKAKTESPDLVAEHISWAINQQEGKRNAAT